MEFYTRSFLKFNKKYFMFTEIVIRYFHPGFNIGIENIRTCWLLGSSPIKLITTIRATFF
jgi:hypothetical protein